ncbi:hypothetical protein BDY17DRAFT_296969 [Neohortaea acidophila]|uniref:Uncharacterized protein n=1 Tax=Neohortaea acidophila TaxID=245834 RepID=A0A6A6PTH1_9PEZI|nr:uncharacterized protein BDY17DRAFT_296969 [Neohortaea acidophila]KAF2483185.1 hypothetical protein BDY17DRAFT_296969 [Neohortaea acidophila]
MSPPLSPASLGRYFPDCAALATSLMLAMTASMTRHLPAHHVSPSVPHSSYSERTHFHVLFSRSLNCNMTAFLPMFAGRCRGTPSQPPTAASTSIQLLPNGPHSTPHVRDSCPHPGNHAPSEPTNPRTSCKPPSNSIRPRYPYLSRSLSAQVEAVKRLFPHARSSSIASPSLATPSTHPSGHQRPVSQHCSYVRRCNPDQRQSTACSTRQQTPYGSIDGVVSRQTSRPNPSSVWSFEDRRSSLTRKPEVPDLRRLSEIDTHQTQSFSCSSPPSGQRVTKDRRRISTVDLQKPLPALPTDNAAARTSHTTVYKQWAPAVTHETITRRTHEVREERITRAIEQHHYYHRTLPVTDINLLAARHFVELPDDGGYLEIPESEVPSELRPTAEEILANAQSLLSLDGKNDLREGELSGLSDGFALSPAHELDADRLKRTSSIDVHPRIMKPAVFGDDARQAILLHVDDKVGQVMA